VKKLPLTAANTLMIISLRLSVDTLQQKGGILMLSSSVREGTTIDPRDKTARTLPGNAAYKHDMLQVYAAELQFSVPLAPYNVMWTRTDDGFFAGYKA